MDTPVAIETPRKTRGDALNLRPYEADLDRWLCVEELTYAATAARLLETHGVTATSKQLWRWLRKHNAQKLRQTVLRNITSGALATRQIREQAERHGTPQLGELISWVRVLIANLATRPDAQVRTEELVALIRPAIEWAKVEQKGEQLDIDRAKLDILQRRAARDEETEKTLANPTLTQDEKMARFREIFGLAT